MTVWFGGKPMSASDMAGVQPITSSCMWGCKRNEYGTYNNSNIHTFICTVTGKDVNCTWYTGTHWISLY